MTLQNEIAEKKTKKHTMTLKPHYYFFRLGLEYYLQEEKTYNLLKYKKWDLHKNFISSVNHFWFSLFFYFSNTFPSKTELEKMSRKKKSYMVSHTVRLIEALTNRMKKNIVSDKL